MLDQDTLNHISLCANYLAYCQKSFQFSRHPSPIVNGWKIIDTKCCPVRNVLYVLPDSDTDDIDDCSQTESTESENDD